jgi:hypothetical protein
MNIKKEEKLKSMQTKANSLKILRDGDRHVASNYVVWLII